MTEVDTTLAAPDLPRSRRSSHRVSVNGVNQEAMSSVTSLGEMEARCGGCKKIIDQENGGIVVAFGSALWHVDCFRCAKCNEKVSADTNLLLLSDGNPVCGNCSYQCFVCKQAITEEAIMTGDESYHAHCFTCRTCKRRIEELVFAKTTQGIYCMSCHNERVARSRRHAEAKRQRAARKERERAEAEKKRAEREGGTDAVGPLPPGVGAGAGAGAAAGGARLPALSTSTSLNLLASGGAPPSSSNVTDRNASAPTSPTFQSNVRPASPRRSMSGPYNETNPGKHQAREPSVDHGGLSSPTTGTRTGAPRPGSPAIITPRQGAPPTLDTTAISSRDWSSDNEVSRSATASPVMPLSPASPYAITNVVGGGTPGGGTSVQSSPSAPNLSGTLGTPQRNASPMGPRSPTGAPGLSPSGGGGGGAGLGVPSTKASKRRSINPGMVYNVDLANSSFASEPRAPSPLRTSSSDPRDHPSRSNTPSTLTSPTRTTTSASQDSESTIRAAPSFGQNDRSASPAPHSQSPETIRDDGSGKPSMPRISAPTIGNMSFSLSDPDFASLLQEMESSGKSAAEIIAAKEAHEKATSLDSHGATGESSASASPESPAVVTISHSPPIPNGSDKMPHSQSMGLLSPNESKLPPAGTPRRRPSVESAISVRMDPENAIVTLKEIVASARPDATEVSVDITLLNEIIREHDSLRDTAMMLKNKYSGAKRSSQQYSEGLTIAGEEYDKEVALRRELEAEISRLRAQVHGQTARLSVISSDERRAESMRRRSQDLANSLSTLERDISRLRAQRDISLAEVEELQASKGGVATGEMEYVDDAPSMLDRSLSRRLETIKEQYRDEIGPLSAQREVLHREINELRETKQQFLEESTSLAAKNEELAELNSQLSRQMESMENKLKPSTAASTLKPALHGHKAGSPSMSSLAPTLPEVQEETARVIRVPKPEPIEAAPARRFKWIKSNAGAKLTAADREKKNNGLRPSTEVGLRDHNFQQHSTMRLGRCELCQDKMWGLQEVKCGQCGIVCHSKCADKLPRSCTGKEIKKEPVDEGPLPPSMFGRDLTEQALADLSPVPVIVTKCVHAVEANGMEYEGIYRKTGGSTQSKMITQLFERGNYDRFDLMDTDSFNDISSITSVLKSYFRQLPNPLLTHDLHESFVAAANIRDSKNKHQALCALLKELPTHHYNTLKVLMLHLNRVTAKSAVNLMTSQNLGVVFGPTLLRSKDPGREFGDMAGKAMSVQWMVENAPTVFQDERE